MSRVLSGFIGQDGQVHAKQSEGCFSMRGHCGAMQDSVKLGVRVPVFMPLPKHPICNNCVREIEDEHATKEERNGPDKETATRG